jgi:predicted amidohydrolase YtcJ
MAGVAGMWTVDPSRPEATAGLKVVMTVVGGKVVYERR